MSIRPRRIPSYRLHKPTGQAVVRIEGHDHYLGKHGTPESQEKYDRLIAEWLVKGQPATPTVPAKPAVDISVNGLILSFYRHAEKHYRRPDGSMTGEVGNLRDALRPLRKLYGTTPARQFGPLALRAVQEEMVRAGLARTTVNARINRIRRMFKWAVGVELLPPEVYQALRAVPGLQRGRCDAPEPEPVRPVPAEHVEAVLPLVPRPVRAMIQLQRLTGCRPEEVAVIRGSDLTLANPIGNTAPSRTRTSGGGNNGLFCWDRRLRLSWRSF